MKATCPECGANLISTKIMATPPGVNPFMCSKCKWKGELRDEEEGKTPLEWRLQRAPNDQFRLIEVRGEKLCAVGLSVSTDSAVAACVIFKATLTGMLKALNRPVVEIRQSVVEVDDDENTERSD